MDRSQCLHQKNATKQTIKKKKAIKVVYISNPMKVKTSASEFRALVQELTGQNSDLVDPARYGPVIDHAVDGHDQMDGDPHATVVDPSNELSTNSDLSFEPSGFLYESLHVEVLPSFDAMMLI